MTSEEPSGNPVAVEVREDIPLRPNDSGSFSYRFGGIRLIIASFTILSLAVTIALGTQIYYGDFELVPHGSVATDSQECSEIGTDILKYGGTSVDAAIGAAFCLSVVNQHTTGLDAGGIMMIYDYRHSRHSSPIIIDFSKSSTSEIPQLVRGLAFIHEKFGSLEWEHIIKPSVDLARYGFSIPSTLVTALEKIGATHLFPGVEPGFNYTSPQLGSYLDNISKANTSALYSTRGISTTEANSLEYQNFIIHTPHLKSATILYNYLKSRNTSFGENYNSPEKVFRRAQNLRVELEDFTPPGATSNIAVIDKDEIYVSLITGLHVMLGSQRLSPNGYIINEPDPIPPTNSKAFSFMVPIIITQHQTCGQRLVLSCGELGSIAQVIEYLIAQEQQSSKTLVLALENQRLHIFARSTIAIEYSHDPRYDDITLRTLTNFGPLTPAAEPYATCNGVQQIGDTLSSHSDSRGGGISSRFK